MLESAVLLVSTISHFTSIHVWLSTLMVQTAILMLCGAIVTELVGFTRSAERWLVMIVEGTVFLLFSGEYRLLVNVIFRSNRQLLMITWKL